MDMFFDDLGLRSKGRPLCSGGGGGGVGLLASWVFPGPEAIVAGRKACREGVRRVCFANLGEDGGGGEIRNKLHSSPGNCKTNLLNLINSSLTFVGYYSSYG